MNDIIIAIISLIGAFLIAFLTAFFNRRKTDAEITHIYARLGLDRKKVQAETADTWMDVARKAAEEYERVMKENTSLKQQVIRLNQRIGALQKRIRSLENKKKRKR